jgi:hypothetical protein
MNTEQYATTDVMLAQLEAAKQAEQDRQTIREHLDKKFLDAMKRVFCYDQPSLAYYQHEDGSPANGQDYNMVVLNGAVRDGQKRVIATLEYIFHNQNA